MTFESLKKAQTFLESDQGKNLDLIVGMLAATRASSDQLLKYISNVYDHVSDSFINGYMDLLTDNEKLYIKTIYSKIKEISDLSDQLSAGV